MDGKHSPLTLPNNHRHGAYPTGETLVIPSREATPSSRPRLIDNGRGDIAVRDTARDPAEESLILRSRRPAAR
jgi:hypothetical protein